MQIKVVDYDQNWPNEFRKEEAVIREMLQEQVINIFHIGSTSVPGLKAKPIIDILLVVQDIHVLDKLTNQWEEIGYEVMGEFGLAGRRYFRKGIERRTHHVHAYQFDSCREILRHLAFRDYLREHRNVCVQYETLKMELAAKFSNDNRSYSEGKDHLVKTIERDALKWYWANRSPF